MAVPSSHTCACGHSCKAKSAKTMSLQDGWTCIDPVIITSLMMCSPDKQSGPTKCDTAHRNRDEFHSDRSQSVSRLALTHLNWRE
jgi:hypothetical protein